MKLNPFQIWRWTLKSWQFCIYLDIHIWYIRFLYLRQFLLSKICKDEPSMLREPQPEMCNLRLVCLISLLRWKRLPICPFCSNFLAFLLLVLLRFNCLFSVQFVSSFKKYLWIYFSIIYAQVWFIELTKKMQFCWSRCKILLVEM